MARSLDACSRPVGLIGERLRTSPSLHNRSRHAAGRVLEAETGAGLAHHGERAAKVACRRAPSSAGARMNFEIERKFLVRGDGWRDHVTSCTSIRQAYLTADGKASIRVRIKGDGTATLT